MKKFNYWFLRTACSAVCCLIGVSVYAVPADPSWQTQTMPDGTIIEVRQIGDEYYAYWETRDGRIAEEQRDGKFIITDQKCPTGEEFAIRRAQARQEAAGPHKVVGTKPNLAPKGVVILVNFTNSRFAEGNTRDVFDNMCNATECTTNAYEGVQYGSAAQYFYDQSNGTYRPVFDVFGPVDLPQEVVYYGEQGERDGRKKNDLYMADFVIDAVLAADSAGCDFTQYDSDDDGYVDFVYFIYAGKGQSNGGTSETIWPHNWTLISALRSGDTHGETPYYYTDENDYNLLKADGKYINNYACSAELNRQTELGGIGTLCHEFGHVMGLPDLYDTQYGANYNAGIIPNEWDIMSGGSYNGNGHCPPNYDPIEKYFFGWVEPVNPGRQQADITLYPNGTKQYNVYQINASGEKEEVLKERLNYYLECRKKTGWDSYLPAEGMIIWRNDYDETAWVANSPNNEPGNPRLIPVCSAGAMVGKANAEGNVFPNGDITSWEDGKGNKITDITKTDDNVSFRFSYDDTPVEPKWTDWAYYDNGTVRSGFGNQGDEVYWGVMFPANTLANNLLTKVSIYERAGKNTKPIYITVYSGGIVPVQANEIHQEKITPSGETGFHEITLQVPARFDTKRNLWIILSTEGDQYPAVASEDTGDRNGHWISHNGTNWREVTTQGKHFTWMIRGYFEPGPPLWTEWAHYDDGTPAKNIGSNGNFFYWGVMFPGRSLGNDTLTKVSVYEKPNVNTQPITIDIYSDGDKPRPENKIYTETFEPKGEEGFHEVTLKKPVVFNKDNNLWIILSESGDSHPAIASADTGDRNGHWISNDCKSWREVKVGGLHYTWMIRAYIGKSSQQGLESVIPAGTGTEKVLYDGQILIIRDGNIFNILGTKIQ